MANILYVRLTEAQSEDLKRRAEEERISVAAVARRALWPPAPPKKGKASHGD